MTGFVPVFQWNPRVVSKCARTERRDVGLSVAMGYGNRNMDAFRELAGDILSNMNIEKPETSEGEAKVDSSDYKKKVEGMLQRIEWEKRATRIQVADTHLVLNTPMDADFEAMGYEVALFGMGCFWGAERLFWETEGVFSTAVGYAGGPLVNPTYREVCAGDTGHAEVVRVVYDPAKTSYLELLHKFWGNHTTTTPNRQGADVGTQYRSVAYFFNEEQEKVLLATRSQYQKQLSEQNLGDISTEIRPAPAFYFAEDYHQQYLEKNPWATCNPVGPGVYQPMENYLQQAS